MYYTICCDLSLSNVRWKPYQYKATITYNYADPYTLYCALSTNFSLS